MKTQATDNSSQAQRDHPHHERARLKRAGQISRRALAWQRERTRIIHHINLRLAAGLARGQTVRQAAARPARRWRGRCYRSAPDRPVRLSAKTIVRLYYRWRAGGRTPAAVALRYAGANRKLPADQILDLSRASLAPDVLSLRLAYARLANPAGTIHAFRHSLPERARQALVKLFAARRAVARLRDEARREVEALNLCLLNL